MISTISGILQLLFITDVYIELNECESLPCVYGTCKDGINNYYCNCTPGYTGKDCNVGMTICFLSSME